MSTSVEESTELTVVSSKVEASNTTQVESSQEKVESSQEKVESSPSQEKVESSQEKVISYNAEEIQATESKPIKQESKSFTVEKLPVSCVTAESQQSELKVEKFESSTVEEHPFSRVTGECQQSEPRAENQTEKSVSYEQVGIASNTEKSQTMEGKQMHLPEEAGEPKKEDKHLGPYLNQMAPQEVSVSHGQYSICRCGQAPPHGLFPNGFIVQSCETSYLCKIAESPSVTAGDCRPTRDTDVREIPQRVVHASFHDTPMKRCASLEKIHRVLAQNNYVKNLQACFEAEIERDCYLEENLRTESMFGSESIEPQKQTCMSMTCSRGICKDESTLYRPCDYYGGISSQPFCKEASIDDHFMHHARYCSSCLNLIEQSCDTSDDCFYCMKCDYCDVLQPKRNTKENYCNMEDRTVKQSCTENRMPSCMCSGGVLSRTSPECVEFQGRPVSRSSCTNTLASQPIETCFSQNTACFEGCSSFSPCWHMGASEVCEVEDACSFCRCSPHLSQLYGRTMSPSCADSELVPDVMEEILRLQ